MRLNLGLALITGALTLGFWMGLGPAEILKSLSNSLLDYQTWSLALIVWLIMIMSRIMEESGHMGRLVKSFTRLSKDPRAVGSVMSALIGLLPMPGGALFSAPMVEASLTNTTATPENKAALNYWFRHIWEYWWPLYPGVILAIALLEVETWHYMSVMAPMTILSIGAGIIFIIRPMGTKDQNEKAHPTWEGIKIFLREMLPILIVIFFIVTLTGLVGLLEFADIHLNIPALFPILPGLVISIFWVCHVNKTPLSRLYLSVINKSNLIMLFLIISIMLFKGMMAETGAVTSIRNELMGFGIPVILLVLIMPFLSGFILGIAVGFVGASFPLIIPLFHTTDMFDYLSYAALAYSFGYMGMMLSPVHLCFLVTKDYFKASLTGTYKFLIRPALTVMSAAIALFLITRLI